MNEEIWDDLATAAIGIFEAKSPWKESLHWADCDEHHARIQSLGKAYGFVSCALVQEYDRYVISVVWADGTHQSIYRPYERFEAAMSRLYGADKPENL